MGKSKIISTAGCFPPFYYSQAEILDAILQMWPLSERRAERLKQFHQNVQVGGRHLAQPLEAYKQVRNFGERNDAWIAAALDLGEAALRSVLTQSAAQPEEVSVLGFTTITGIAAPSIDARLMNRIPFSKNMKRMPFFGYGCVGGAAGIARLDDYLQGRPQDLAALLSVELCSLTIQYDDLSVANMISSGLFGDGAAAVLIAGGEHPLAALPGPEIVDTSAVFFPETEHIMGWDVQAGGLKIVLSADVADVAGSALRPEVEEFLGLHGLTIPDITHWIAHPGGPKVIQALEEGLGLPTGALDLSRESLAQVGNLSSTSVLMILQETLQRCNPAPGAYGLLLAMGPAFCAEMALLRW